MTVMIKIEDYKTKNSAKTRRKPQKRNKFCPNPKSEAKALTYRALAGFRTDLSLSVI